MQGTEILVSTNEREPWRRRLTLPTYQVKDAARYAGITTQTVRNWQKTVETAGSAIADRKAREALSYLQLQELAIVSAMRVRGVELKKIRIAREYLSTQLKLEFPFSDPRVKDDGQDILLTLKDELGGALRMLVANKGGQYVWNHIIQERFAEFDYEDDLAVRWRIGRGNQSGIIIDPRISFGAPTIRGVPTWAVTGRYRAGEAIEDIADDFVITPEEVKKAIAFERVTLH